jgi:quercetin dioxygenase-like cupin family protein
MRLTVLTVSLLAAAASASAQSPAAAAPPAIKWGPAPEVFPAGAQMAVLSGNPGGKGLFTVRLKFPNGYRIAPHTHPTDENLTVISGTFNVGMGKTFDAKQMMTLKTGGFATAPANMAHYAQARGATIVQVHAEGPFALTYVNPADMPKAVARK